MGSKFKNPDAIFSVFKLTVLFLLGTIGAAPEVEEVSFTYNGFRRANVSLDGIAKITSNGLLMLTNNTKLQKGHAFYTHPIRFLYPSSSSSSGGIVALSFSTTFVFAILSQYPDLGGHGIAFVIAPTRGLPGSLPTEYLGLFNYTNVGNSTNHVFAVEIDTIESKEFNDINDHHVGIDINGLKSVASAPASYFDKKGRPENLSLLSGHSMQVWVDYDGVQKHLNVTLAPINVPKPEIPLLSMSLDLSPVMLESMFVGFSSSTGSILTSHYVLGWSFKMNGRAEELNLSQLPKMPRRGSNQKPAIKMLMGLPAIAATLVLVTILGFLIIVRRKRKFAEVVEEWELDYRSHRFGYKELYVATKGFRHNELLGIGGFGSVYRGVLPTSKIEIAVKKISHESRQGMKEFVAEIVSLGQLRHRNLVTLLGYCWRKGELLLVYEFMANGSLDKFLFDPSMAAVLNWRQRFRIIRGVASALCYLHEEWEQVVVHRDVKSSNVLLDGEMNGRLGDFGLARLYDHGANPQTTHVVGTLGYLAPELSRTGKANPSIDVFAFGAFMLEVACGRRPIEPRVSAEDVVLVDMVFSCWSRGTILDTVDPKLGINYVKREMEVVLKLGLLCSNCIPTGRPSMRQVVQYLEGELPLPDLSSLNLSASGLTFVDGEGFDDIAMSYSSLYKIPPSLSVSESILSGGR